MENRISKRNVALVEKCVMSTIGIKGLFDAMPGDAANLLI